MGDTAKQNFHLATDPLFGSAAANEEIFHEHEAFLDRAEVEIGRYLTTIHNIRSVDQRRQMAEMMHSLSDFEKIGDLSLIHIWRHCVCAARTTAAYAA